MLRRRHKGPSTAKHRARVYWIATKLLFKSSCASKRDDFRVRPDNPTSGVEGPSRSLVEVTHQWLYPSEFPRIMACARISAKQPFWIACFTLTGPHPALPLLINAPWIADGAHWRSACRRHDRPDRALHVTGVYPRTQFRPRNAEAPSSRGDCGRRCCPHNRL